ncbi:MAG: hypothetical protein C0433_10430 [Cyclobacterium sp.]|nr:hypothetical protein [Cyclobacterium sp.]
MVSKQPLPYFLAFTLLFLSNFSLWAQETTGKLQGFVLDNDKTPIPGALIRVENRSNGSRFIVFSQNDGYYEFNQLPPAETYQLTVQYIGFLDFSETAVKVNLGKTTTVTILLNPEDLQLDEVLITAGVDFIENPKKGNETSIDGTALSKIPSLNRSIQDATRLIPESNLNSFGGANYRFNNLSIDGLATNDVFGFQEPSSGAAGSTASGTPGGLAGTQPIGFGAIEELSVKIAPFDVSYGNFSGASINVVTKSGTNDFVGSLYGFGRNELLQGKFAGGEQQEKAAFKDAQFGMSLGGPIIKNKLFYFLNVERSYRNAPLLNAPGSLSSNIPLALVTAISDTLQSRYGYDPGAYQKTAIERASTKYFLRFDFNLSERHKLTLRNNLVQGYADNLEWSQNFFNFGNQGFRHNTFTNSFLAELKSNLGPNLSNKFTIGNTHVNDNRTYAGDVFPHLEITYNTANTIFAGTYREAAIYGLKLNTTQISDNLTLYKDRHILTFGGNAELSSIQFNFLTAYNGRWQYSSEEAFFNDQPSRVRGVYNVQNNAFDFNKNIPSADYGVLLLAFYAQDEFRVNQKLNIQSGVRVDMQNHIGKFPLNPDLNVNPEFAGFENDINTKPQLNPRVSFDYRWKENVLFRGGTGLFTSRMPFLWYAYVHYNSGITYNNIDYRPAGPLPITRDLSELAALQPKLTEINLVDNGFQLPRDWKTNFAADIRLKNGFELTLEATYAKVMSGLLFQSINRKDSVGNFSGADNRSYFLSGGKSIQINPNFTNVFLLTNTNQGWRYNLTAGLSKKTKTYQGYIGYTFGESKDISSTVRSSHAANFEWNQAINGNNPGLAYSNFDLRHKIISTQFLNFGLGKNQFMTIGLVYNGRAGSPFTFVYEGDLNRDGSAKNDLIYIPEKQEDIKFRPIRNSNGQIRVSESEQWQQLDAYLNSNSYLKANRGSYAERNAARTPWNHQVDLRLSSNRVFGDNGNQLNLTLDVFNFGNLLNRNWGKQHFVPNVQNSGFGLIDFVGIEGERPVFQFKNPEGTPWLIDPIESRWQMQLGLAYTF